MGRYTFIGLTPFKRIVARGREIAITEGRKTTHLEGDVFAVLRDALSGHKPARLKGLPPFTAGAVGYLAYDAVRQIERLPTLAKDELHVPDACLLFFDEVLAFDHVRKEIMLVVTADVSKGAAAAAYDRALKRLNRLEKRLSQPLPNLGRKRDPKKPRPSSKLKVKHRTHEEGLYGRGGAHQGIHPRGRRLSSGHLAALRRRPRSGQLPGLSRAAHRQSQPVYVLPALLTGGSAGSEAGKRSLSKKSKGPENLPLELAGSSPELLVRVHQGKVEYRPIAGSRPRGSTEAKDDALAEEMLHDEKERAEHVMLVDLGRNDVGRVSRFGSVKVDKLMFVERYSHIMHIVSTIEGKLRPELTAVDALRACFPAGTLSGAPKVRAMEIIEELEPCAARHLRRRGSLRRFLRQSRLLHRHPLHAERRTARARCRPARASSPTPCPRLEHQESLNKAQAVLRAIERAREM